jgi:hypothetical protein
MLVSGKISANAKDYHVFMEYYVDWTFFFWVSRYCVCRNNNVKS